MTHELFVDLPDPTTDQLKVIRKAAALTQRKAAELVGLSDHMRWSEFERGLTVISTERWALFLLAIDQHPRLRLTVRRRGAHPPRGDVAQPPPANSDLHPVPGKSEPLTKVAP